MPSAMSMQRCKAVTKLAMSVSSDDDVAVKAIVLKWLDSLKELDLRVDYSFRSIDCETLVITGDECMYKLHPNLSASGRSYHIAEELEKTRQALDDRCSDTEMSTEGMESLGWYTAQMMNDDVRSGRIKYKSIREYARVYYELRFAHYKEDKRLESSQLASYFRMVMPLKRNVDKYRTLLDKYMSAEELTPVEVGDYFGAWIRGVDSLELVVTLEDAKIPVEAKDSRIVSARAHLKEIKANFDERFKTANIDLTCRYADEKKLHTDITYEALSVLADITLTNRLASLRSWLMLQNFCT